VIAGIDSAPRAAVAVEEGEAAATREPMRAQPSARMGAPGD